MFSRFVDRGAAVTPMTFQSVNADLPTGDAVFSGSGSDPVNTNCLACHSAEMVLTQPALPKEKWGEVVHKMINVYKAPIDESDIDPIVSYLSALPTKQ